MRVEIAMDWPAIIENHRQALKGVLASLLVLAACLDRGPMLPRHLRLAVLRLLRPAEAAARRLVILTALRLPMAPLPPPRRRKPRPPPLRWPGGVVIHLGLAIPPTLTPPHKGEGTPAALATPSPLWGSEGRARPVARPGEGGGRDASPRPPAFRLLDPPRRIARARQPVRASVPRISVPGVTAPHPIARRGDAVDGAPLGRRLAALKAALDDLPAQARRFAFWEARNARARAAGRRRRIGPLRTGRPPGQHRRRPHAAHHLLAKLHDYASFALECRDTS
jgi:hypothetical protein